MEYVFMIGNIDIEGLHIHGVYTSLAQAKLAKRPFDTACRRAWPKSYDASEYRIVRIPLNRAADLMDLGQTAFDRKDPDFGPMPVEGDGDVSP